jgi:Xaa-Pro aminopeptidase
MTGMFETAVYINRRAVLKQHVGAGVILFLGNDLCSINYRDNCYPFRQDSCFLYYFGLLRPGLFALIDIDQQEEVLYGQDQTLDELIFSGPAPDLKTLAERAGVSRAASDTALPAVLKKALDKRRQVHFLPPYRDEHEKKLRVLLQDAGNPSLPGPSVTLIQAIVKQRSVKTGAELQEIERAVNLTAAMQLRTMQTATAGQTEMELAAAIAEMALAGGGTTAFPSIVTTHGEILHNFSSNNKLRNGEMLLCDCGAEMENGYAGDLSRTFPVEKRFSTKQREIYEIVWQSYQHAVLQLSPGRSFYDIHLLASGKIAEGLKSLGLMKGDPAEAVRMGAVTLFFPCGLGHMMGLDVHDMENLGEEYVGYTETIKKSGEFGFKSLRLGRKLEPGFVLTVEPGIYFIPELIALRKSQKRYLDFINYEKLESYIGFGGIRIEDDYVITQDGYHRLGKPLPTTAREMEDAREACSEGTLIQSL